MYPEYESKMKKTIEVLKTQFATVRAGRANPAVLDQISVSYYGVDTPINQIGSISSPDPRTLLIQPWDASSLKNIEKAIQASELGINPQNDGRQIRLIFPQLTEERRRELAKQVINYRPASVLTGYKKQNCLKKGQFHIFDSLRRRDSNDL